MLQQKRLHLTFLPHQVLQVLGLETGQIEVERVGTGSVLPHLQESEPFRQVTGHAGQARVLGLHRGGGARCALLKGEKKMVVLVVRVLLEQPEGEGCGGLQRRDLGGVVPVGAARVQHQQPDLMT